MAPEIQYLTHGNIDKVEWDKGIFNSANGMVYAQSWFLDIVSPGWDALVTTGYKSLMPLTWRKKFGIKYLYQPPFTQQLGIFSAEQKISAELLSGFIRAIPASFRYIDIFINSQDTPAASQATGFKAFPRLTHHLSLAGDYADIRKNYSENQVRSLKKAAVNNLALEENVPVAELIQLFRTNRGQSIETLGNHEYGILRAIAETGITKGLVTLTGIRSNGVLIAGAFFLESNNEFIFFFSATAEEGKKAGAMNAVIDSFIRKHIGMKSVLDFEGSMDKNLSRFYKSFGANEIVYLHIQINRLPKIISWLKK